MSIKRLKPLKSKRVRQEIDDMSEVNPATGLPKHIYNYKDVGVRGIFQIKGKRSYTPIVRFGDNEDFKTKDEAIAHCQVLLEALKKERGWYDYVESREWLENASTNGVIMPNQDA